MGMGLGDLTHAERARLKLHLPKSGKRGGRWVSHRRVINGILYRPRTGMPWRYPPACFGPWKTVYERHRRWSMVVVRPPGMTGQPLDAGLSVDEFTHDVEVAVVAGNLFDEVEDHPAQVHVAAVADRTFGR